jgi:hypothetical protein
MQLQFARPPFSCILWLDGSNRALAPMLGGGKREKGVSGKTSPGEPEASRSPWNSLEVAKIVMSAATPLAVLAIGFLVTQQAARQEKQEKDRQAEAADNRERIAEAGRVAREAQVRNEMAARETEARQAAALLQRELRDLADERERQLRREGFAREKALRDEAFRREEAVRREGMALAQSSKLIERRIEFWDKLAPNLSHVDRAIDRILVGQGTGEDVEGIFREGDDLFGLYRPYFSPKFETQYEQYKHRVRAFVALASRSTTLKTLVVTDGLNSICRGYVGLRNVAAIEVAQTTGLVDVAASAGPSAIKVEDECERRVDNALVKLKRPS